MKNIYLAIWYECNQKCTGCPCGLNNDKDKVLSKEQIVKILDTHEYGENTCVTLSGGEPSLHPQFFDILNSIKRHRMYVAILSNAEVFSSNSFVDSFLECIDLEKTRVITTIHGSNCELHESQNNSIGSFNRTITGLQNLISKGVKVTVKHCISSKNYKDTTKYMEFIDNTFPPNVDIQLFGMDYCGLSEKNAWDLYAPFDEMRPWIEEGIDTFLELSRKNNRKIQIKNIPLCAIDPFYWNLFAIKDNPTSYNEYFSPTISLENKDDESGKYSINCTYCCVREICHGTYKSVIDYFGDDAVKAIMPCEE